MLVGPLAFPCKWKIYPPSANLQIYLQFLFSERIQAAKVYLAFLLNGSQYMKAGIHSDYGPWL